MPFAQDLGRAILPSEPLGRGIHEQPVSRLVLTAAQRYILFCGCHGTSENICYNTRLRLAAGKGAMAGSGPGRGGHQTQQSLQPHRVLGSISNSLLICTVTCICVCATHILSGKQASWVSRPSRFFIMKYSQFLVLGFLEGDGWLVCLFLFSSMFWFGLA